MKNQSTTLKALRAEVKDLRSKLTEAQENLDAVHSVMADAGLVSRSQSDQRTCTLSNVDEPYKLMVHAISEGAISYLTDGTILFSNLRMAELLGLPLDQFIGAKIQSFVATSERLGFVARLVQCGLVAQHWRCTLQAANRDKLVVQFSTLPFILNTRQAIVAVITDLSDLSVTAQTLYESEEKFRSVFDHSPIGQSITALDGSMDVNQAFCSMLGYKGSELRQRRWQDITHPDDIALTQAAIAPLLAGTLELTRVTKRYLHKNGGEVWADVNAAVRLDGEGKPRYFITSVIDISERKQVELREHEFTLKIERAMFGTVGAVSQMMERRDPYTSGHERRVGELAAAISAEMGLDHNAQIGMRVAGNLHDVGKIAVPVEILSKPGKLTELEYDLIKTHAEQGYQVLKDVEFPWPVAEVARQHHERMDGSGYPRGLKGGEILLEARILAVADVVEAMSSHRPYRPGIGMSAALNEIESGSGTHYDPKAVAACLRLFREKGYAIAQ